MKRLGFACIAFLALCLSAVSCAGPAPKPTEIQETGNLEIVFPLATTEIAGGQTVRITAYLTDQAGEAIEGAFVEVELWTPAGERFARLPCPDAKSGRYLADAVALPLRDSGGIWRITARGILDNEEIVEAEGQFLGQYSYSERLSEAFDFWIDLTDLFPYNIASAEDPQLKTYTYEDGGYIILANNLTTTQINNSFVILDVHWRETQFPKDDLSAAEYVLGLAGPHRISLDISPSDLDVEKDTFLDSDAWHVSGWWNPENALGNPRPDSPLDWMVFQCPGSKTIWTVLITSNEMKYMDELKLIRESFECTPGQN